MQLIAHRGLEFVLDPRLNRFHRLYVRLFGIPISGMRIRLRRILPVIQGDFRRILDAGCGKGVFSFELAKRFQQAQITGIDTESGQVEINNAIASRAGIENARFETQDLLKVEWKNRFDLVVCVDNLEHIDDDRLAISRLYDCLTPGGTLVCHVPAYERTWVFFRRSVNFDVPGHVRPGYRAEEIAEKIHSAGFTEVKVQHTFGYLETVANNLSYLITGASQKNVLGYALAFPFLNLLAWLGRRQNAEGKGAGVLVVARKAA